jgi:hypothetical protein
MGQASPVLESKDARAPHLKIAASATEGVLAQDVSLLQKDSSKR